MNLNYSELKESVKIVRNKFIFGDTWRFGKVQKAYSSGNIIILNIRIPGETLYLGLGRGGEYCGVWLLAKQIPSEYRIVKDQFLEYIRSNFVGKSIIDFKIDPVDKIISLEFSDGTILFLFWKGRKLYFTAIENKDGEKFEFSPWKSLKRIKASKLDFSIFDSLGRKQLDEKEINHSKMQIDIDAIHQDGLKSKQRAKGERKILNIRKDLYNCAIWPELQEKLINDELDLEKDSFHYKGYRNKFKSHQSFYERRNILFDKIKKLKIGENILKERLSKFEESFKRTKTILDQKIHYPIWTAEVATEIKVDKKGNIKIYEIQNHKFGIGLNTIGNDLLRTKWSSKSDIWLHLDGYKSSHVIIKGDMCGDINIISIGASLLAEYSNFDAQQIPIIFTQVSNLKGVKGKSGSVTYKKEKKILVQKIKLTEIISTSWLE